MDEKPARRRARRTPAIVLGMLLVVIAAVIGWRFLGLGTGLVGTWRSGDSYVAFGIGGRGSLYQAAGEEQDFVWRVSDDVLTIETASYTRRFDVEWRSRDRFVLTERWRAGAEKLTFTRVQRE